MEGIERKINLKKFLTPLSRDTEEMQAIAETETVELQALWDALCDVFDNQFIVYMTGYGLRQWESIFDVAVKASDTLTKRRQRILQLLMGTRPYTLESFQDMLDRIYGEGNVKVRLWGNEYEIWLKLPGDFNYRARDVRDFAEVIVPKNLLIFMRNAKRVSGSQYIGSWAHQHNRVHIEANTSVEIGDMTGCQHYASYAHINTNVRI